MFEILRKTFFYKIVNNNNGSSDIYTTKFVLINSHCTVSLVVRCLRTSHQAHAGPIPFETDIFSTVFYVFTSLLMHPIFFIFLLSSYIFFFIFTERKNTQTF